MPEFMVTMEIAFPQPFELGEIRRLLVAEGAAFQPYVESGMVERVWRTYGDWEGNHGHMSLWDAPDATMIKAAYAQFPLVTGGYAHHLLVSELLANPHDPGASGATATLPDVPFPLTWQNLHEFLTLHGQTSHITDEGMTAVITRDLSVHDHPHSDRPREIHVMIVDTKIAEIGPVTAAPDEAIGPGYIGLLPEWAGQPVGHDNWKRRILADNGLLHPTYEAAVTAQRVFR